MLPTTYDPLFAKHAGSIPVAFLRALTKKESGFDPRDTTGPAWGLMQIVEVVRRDNLGLAPTRSHLLNPEINIAIATKLLKRIVASYKRNHTDRNMQPDWTNPEFVKLVLAGWNSGWSEGGGVGRVARYLEQRGIPVTHDNVFAAAGAAGATSQLQKSGKKRWQAEVATLYFQQPDAGKVASGNVFLKLALAVGAGYLLTRIID